MAPEDVAPRLAEEAVMDHNALDKLRVTEESEREYLQGLAEEIAI